MTTIINTPGRGDGDGGWGFVFGILIILLIGVLFFIYGLPYIRGNNVPSEPNDSANINITIPTPNSNTNSSPNNN